MKKAGIFVASFAALAASIGAFAGISSLKFKEVKAVSMTTQVAKADFTAKATSHSNYGDTWTYGNDWSIYGGANNSAGWAYMRFGKKDSANQQCYCATAKALESEISEVVVTTNSGNLSTSGTLNSWGLYVYSDSDMKTKIDYVAGENMTANKAETFTLTPSAGVTWASGYYYKVLFDTSASKNGLVYIDSIAFNNISESSATLQSISTSGQTTQYEVGDAFEYDGTLTATYSDGITQTVKPSSIGMPDLTTAGEKTVKLSYSDGENAVYLEYTVTVSECAWYPVTSLYDIKDGDKVTFASMGDKSYAVMGTTASNYQMPYAIGTETSAGGLQRLGSAFEWTVGSSGDYKTFKNDENLYLQATLYRDTMELCTNKSLSKSGTKWTLTFADDGSLSMKSDNSYYPTLDTAKEYFTAGTAETSIRMFKKVSGTPAYDQAVFSVEELNITTGETGSFDWNLYPAYVDYESNPVTVSSSDEAVATVEATPASSGKATVTAVKAGSCEIQIKNAEGTTLGSLKVTVSDPVSFDALSFGDSEPTKISYAAGEAFDASGIEVYGSTNGTVESEPLDESLYDLEIVYQNGDAFAYGDTKVTVTATLKTDSAIKVSKDFSVAVASYTLTIDADSKDVIGTTASTRYGERTILAGDASVGYYAIDGYYLTTSRYFQMNGNSSGAGDYGHIANASALPDISKIVVNYNTSTWKGSSKILVGNAYLPSTELTASKTDAANGVIVYDVPAGSAYDHFWYSHYEKGNSQIKSIEVTFAPNAEALPTVGDAYASEFLARTVKGCAAQNVESDTWNILSSVYTNVKDTSLKSASANEGGSIIEQAAARYDVIVAKYGYDDFAGRSPSQSASGLRVLFADSDSDGSAAIWALAAATLAIGAYGAYYALRRRESR